MSDTGYTHVALTAEGVPILAGTQVKVVEVALDHVAHLWGTDEIHCQYPELSLGQIPIAAALRSAATKGGAGIPAFP